MQPINEAVYVQIAPETASEDSNTDDKQLMCQLSLMCGVSIATLLLAAGLGLYFLIKD